jgi:hypothetical protein
MCKNYDGFIGSFSSVNTAKVAKSLSKIGDYDYSYASPIDIEQIILSLKPNSPKAITTIVYIMSLYAKYLENNDLYNMVQDVDRNVIWSIAKKSASKKFISFSTYKDVCTNIDIYEDYNSFYIQTLFRCLYEGIYSDDMSVIKNLRASDVNNNIVTLRRDKEEPYDLLITDELAEDLIKLSSVDIWERRNRYGTCKINISGVYNDSCFKAESRKGSSEYSYRYTYYRILRKISNEYLGYNLLPLQIFVSGIMYRININFIDNGISLKDGFADKNKNRIVNKIISNELNRCHYDIEVRNFREMVSGHIDVFIDQT